MIFDEAYWEDRYRRTHTMWSGRPNPWLVAEAEKLTPGEALDVGCGEGADAIWLAERDWRATGVDLSRTALERAAGHAEAAGVGERTSWVHADAGAWPVPAASFDLVSAQYLHVPAVFARLATAVAPGGHLLVVGHHIILDVEHGIPRPNIPELFRTGEEMAAELDKREWEILAAETRTRQAKPHEGGEGAAHDAVLFARRISAR
jgi:SAM-dependent methyltransferase